jgi:predicted dehydrogenase
MVEISRRRMLGVGAAAFTSASYSRIMGANETVQVGVIGTGVRGGGHVRSLSNIKEFNIVALCDVYGKKAEAAKSTHAPNAATFSDHRKMLELKNLDAVVIATPDHWHVPISTDAIHAGKDVFCEKPITLKIGEGASLLKMVNDSRRIFQSGMQQRSMSHFIQARDEFVKAGKLGKVTMVRTWWHGSVNSFVRPVPPDLEKQPADLDWKRFIEPVEKNRPYQPYQYNCFRAFFDFGGGQFTDLFTHWVDAAHMLVGEDLPDAACATGGQFIPEYRNDGSGRTVPDTVNAQLHYPGDWICTFDATMAAGVDSNGMEFYGTKGKLFITRAGFEFTPADANGPAGYGSGRGRGMGGRGAAPAFPPEPVKNPNAISVRASGGDQHLQNFLDCVKSRKAPNASLLDGLRAAQACHLCSVSYQQGRKLKFDTRHEKLVG